MKDPIVFRYQNRLAKTVAPVGGMNVAEATEAAQLQIDLLRVPTIAHIDGALETIGQMRRRMEAGPAPDALSQMYRAANQIVGTAGLFDLGELGEAAYCLCELVSRFQATGKFNLKLIELNVEGLRLLRTPENHSAIHREAVLVGLNQVAASVV